MHASAERVLGLLHALKSAIGAGEAGAAASLVDEVVELVAGA